MSLERARLSEGKLADIAQVGTIASMASLMHDEVGPLVKRFTTSLVGANIEGALPLSDLVAC